MDITGKNFCITGMLLKQSRSQIKQAIESRGGTLKKNMSSKVDYFVITADCLLEFDGNTAKISKFDPKKTKLINEAILYEMLGIPYDAGDLRALRKKYEKGLARHYIEGLYNLTQKSFQI